MPAAPLLPGDCNLTRRGTPETVVLMSDRSRKSRRIHWALPLAYLCLAAALLSIFHRPSDPGKASAKPESNSSNASPALPGKRVLRQHPSVIRIARVREWMKATALTEHPDDFHLRMWTTVNALTADDLKQLLADLDSLFTTGNPDKFSMRYSLQCALWERYGELSPDDALKLAFPDDKPSPDRRVAPWHVLSGLAKVDPVRSHGILKVQLSSSRADDIEATPANFALSETLAEWAKFAPDAAFAAIRDFPGMERLAYPGYLLGLGTGTRWHDEAARFESIASTLPPDAASRLASRWALHDPEAAFDWILQREPKTSGAVTSMVVTLLREKPEEAAEWIVAWNPDGIDKQAAILGALRWDGLEDESFTSIALPLIADPQQRDRVVMENLETADEKPLRFLASSTLLSQAVRQSAAAKLNEIEARFARK